MHIIISFIYFFLAISFLKAQCPIADFTIQNAPVCTGENLIIENNSTSANAFSWDFCSGDISDQPNGELLSVVEGMDVNFGLAVAEQNDKWYCFATSRDTNKLFRIDLGNNPGGSVNQVVDLGDLNGVLTGPEGIEMLLEKSLWYGLVYNRSTGQILRLEFDTGLNNEPNVTIVFDTGLGANVNLDLGVDGDKIVLLLTDFSSNKLFLLNFGNSIKNNPQSEDFIDAGIISGASGLRGISVINTCDQWYGWAVAQSSKSLHWIEFGTDLFSVPTDDFKVSPSPFGGETPFHLQTVYDAGSFYGLVVTNSGTLYRLDFGADLNGTVISSENLGDLSVLQITRTSAFVSHNSENYLFTSKSDASTLYRIKFPNQCEGDVMESSDELPKDIRYSSSGVFSIDLKVIDNDNQINYQSQSISVTSYSAPIIGFNSDNSCVSNPIQFTHTTDQVLTSFLWNFGDGQTSPESNPAHQYTAPGNYIVRLEVEASNGCGNFIEKEIEIFEEPIPDFTFPTGTLCSNAPIQFTNTTTGETGEVVDWQWDFNGEGASSAKDTSFTFTSGGLKQVTLTASIPGCTNFIGQNITVEQGPVAAFEFQNTCFQEETEFISNSTGTNIPGHFWDFGNGTTSTLENPALVYSEPGEYLVSLQVTNDLGCTTEFIDTVTIHSIPLVNFSNDLACKGAQVQFQDQSLVENANLTEWDWQFNSDQGTLSNITSSEQNPLVVFDAPGEYSVSFSAASNFGCTDTLERSITVLDAPTVEFDYVNACVGDSLMLTDVSDTSGFSIIDKLWKIDTSTFISDNPVVLFNEAGEVDISLTLTSDNLCTVTKSETVFISDFPTTDFSFSSSCLNEMITFTDASDSEIPIVDYEWDFNGLGKSFDPEVNFKFPSSGEFEVTLTVENENGCASGITKSIFIEEAPEASFEVSQTIGASPLEVEVLNNSIGAEEFQWMAGNEVIDEVAPTFIFEDLGTHEVLLVAVSSSGCRDTASHLVEVVVPELEVELQQVNTLIDGDNIQLVLTIGNNGTVLVENLDILVEVGDAIRLTNQFSGSLAPGELVNHTLDFQIVDAPEFLFICISIQDVSREIIDSNLNNNIKCINLADEAIFNDPFPNPVTDDVVTFPLILPVQGSVGFTIVNSIGEIALKRDFNLVEAGLNEFNFDTSALEQGIYLVRIEYAGREETFRIFKQ